MGKISSRKQPEGCCCQTLGLDVLPLGLPGLTIGRSRAVVGFFQISVRLGHQQVSTCPDKKSSAAKASDLSLYHGPGCGSMVVGCWPGSREKAGSAALLGVLEAVPLSLQGFTNRRPQDVDKARHQEAEKSAQYPTGEPAQQGSSQGS